MWEDMLILTGFVMVVLNNPLNSYQAKNEIYI
jgi:hypothetical protein